MKLSDVFAQQWRAFQSGRGGSWFTLLTPILWLIAVAIRFQTGRARQQSGMTRKKTVKDSIPVVSIGNLAVGGTGKTPLTLALAREFQARGYRIGIVSSGYGRSSKLPITGIGSELSHRTHAEIGDEVMLLASALPDAHFSVAKRKSDAAEILQRAKSCDVLLVDDGFQHWGLRRDVDLVLLNAQMAQRAWRQFPLGLLRESEKSLSDADAIIWTKVEPGSDITSQRKTIQSVLPTGTPEFRIEFHQTITDPDGNSVPQEKLRDHRFLLFAGVGDFVSLHSQLVHARLPLAGWIEFADHQDYDDASYRHICETASQVNADVLLTTGKDLVKLDRSKLPLECFTLALELHVTPSMNSLIEMIEATIRARHGGAQHS